MRQRRSHYTPSSSHRLAAIASQAMTRFSRDSCHCATAIQKELESRREEVAKLTGSRSRVDWAISQLTTSPFVVIGWPNPCKAGRMSMRPPQRRGPIAGDPGRKAASR